MPGGRPRPLLAEIAPSWAGAELQLPESGAPTSGRQLVPPRLGLRLRSSSPSDASLLGLERVAATALVWECACAEGAELRRLEGHSRLPWVSIPARRVLLIHEFES